MSIDLSQISLNEYGHVQTFRGLQVRLLCTDQEGVRNKSKCHAVGLIRLDSGEELVRTWRLNGETLSGDQGCDLIPVPKKHVRWVRKFSNDYGIGSCLFTQEEKESSQEAFGVWIPVEIDEARAE